MPVEVHDHGREHRPTAQGVDLRNRFSRTLLRPRTGRRRRSPYRRCLIRAASCSVYQCFIPILKRTRRAIIKVRSKRVIVVAVDGEIIHNGDFASRRSCADRNYVLPGPDPTKWNNVPTAHPPPAERNDVLLVTS